MTEELQEDSTGAPFHGVTDWHAIDWQSATHNVRRLQARIVKATQEKRWGKVKALQRLRQSHLEHSAKEDQRDLLAQAKGLPSPTPQANLYT